MLNSVLIEGIAITGPRNKGQELVEFKIRHSETLILYAFAKGSLGLECLRFLQKGMKVRIVGSLCSKGLQMSYVEFDCKD
jgi:hypothetical protein